MTSEKIDEIVRNRQEKLKKLHDVESNVEKIRICLLYTSPSPRD